MFGCPRDISHHAVRSIALVLMFHFISIFVICWCSHLFCCCVLIFFCFARGIIVYYVLLG
jgi:hypothetical protein